MKSCFLCFDFSDSDLSSLQSSLSSMDLNQTTTTVAIAPGSEMLDIAPSLFASTSSPVSSAVQSSSTSAAHRRTLRPRPDATGSLLHGINRRTISRPRKFSNINSTDVTEKDIIKLYLNKSTGRVKPTSLETIFEVSEEGSENEQTTTGLFDSQVKLVGLKKLKRSLSFSTDHSRTNKTTVLKRRRRIKDRLGTTKKPSKFSMQLFIEKMEAMQNNEKSELHTCDSA